jgi:hypothetical protein
MLIKDRAASFATQKRLASLDREKGNKEKAQIMVRSFKIQGQTAAIQACSGVSVQGDCSRSDASDEEKHQLSSDKTLRSPKTSVNRSLPCRANRCVRIYLDERKWIAFGLHGSLEHGPFPEALVPGVLKLGVLK